MRVLSVLALLGLVAARRLGEEEAPEPTIAPTEEEAETTEAEIPAEETAEQRQLGKKWGRGYGYGGWGRGYGGYGFGGWGGYYGYPSYAYAYPAAYGFGYPAYGYGGYYW
eukprot:Blabericola_migrator_1__10776@NODE_6187_length_583_cov_7_362403_g4160_i0_p2_GENE_NODE_6187_length_583_cov_7_362403_g4160_i0NODE_6187_length_583_cov_7_362403_g4160_i0_p2_ORF_typecomplete_len110_score20_01GRP/PF07172_11/0_0048Betalactamase/PF00144_24/0_0083Keratin_2_head/PF16208_5/1_NODE_6187_length_583_cov_7_362403_g4160_i0119448